FLAFDAEGIETGEQALEGESDAGGTFDAVDCDDFASSAIALDCCPQSHCQRDHLSDAVSFLRADGLGLGAAASEQLYGGIGQLLTPLLGCAAEVSECAVELGLSWCWCESGEEESVAHGTDDGVMGVDHLGCREDEADLTFP